MIASYIRTISLVTGLWGILFVPADAHPISISRASIYLTEDTASVRIDVLLEDLYLFHNLPANHEDRLPRSVILRGVELHEKFLRDRFEITDVNGKRLEPQSAQPVGLSLPEEGVALADLMSHELTYILEYKFSPKPEYLTFTQRFTDEAAVLPSETKLEINQQNVGELSDHSLEPNEPVTLRFNWHLPRLSTDASAAERMKWESKSKEPLLGITNHSNAYSFIYVDDFEVRHEILIPLATLDDDNILPHNGNAILDIGEQDAARNLIANYLAQGIPISINGNNVQPSSAQCKFYGLGQKDLALKADRTNVPISNGRVAAILTYHVNRRVDDLQLEWNCFGAKLWSVRTVVIAGEHVTTQRLRRLGSRNKLTWNHPNSGRTTETIHAIPATMESRRSLSITLPVAMFLTAIAAGLMVAQVRRANQKDRSLVSPAISLSIGLVAVMILGWIVGISKHGSAPSDDECVQIFRSVHSNVYRSFQRRTENTIYDGLAKSVHGDLLTAIYLEVRRGLVQQDEDDVAAQIRDVAYVSTERTRGGENSRGFRVRCCWNVAGTVGHWGHRHLRTNQYEAEFQLNPIEGTWKIVDFDLVSKSRIKSATEVRTQGPSPSDAQQL